MSHFPLPESRTLRRFFMQRLARLAETLSGVRVAGIATEDGLTVATTDETDPSSDDRQAAVMSSLAALARTAARACGLADAQYVLIESAPGLLLVVPFTITQDSGAKRRLLYVVLTQANDIHAVLSVLYAFIEALRQRLTPQG